MSQTDRLRALDARIHGAMLRDGLAGEGTYTAPAGSPVPVRCFVNRGLAEAGEYAPTFGARITVDLFRADVATPEVGGVVDVDGEQFRLTTPDTTLSDESLTRWVVTRV